MEHAHHGPQPEPTRVSPVPHSIERTALAATLHCLLGCAIGEVAGLVLGTALGWGAGPTIALAVVLAFISGIALTLVPLARAGHPLRRALRIALAADTLSIVIMEVVDNAVMLAVPGAMGASVWSLHFWASMAASLAVAGIAAYPVNRWLIARGQGHAAAHGHHGTGAGPSSRR